MATVELRCQGRRKRGSHKGQDCHRIVLTVDPETGVLTATCAECGSPMTLLITNWVVAT